MIETLQKNSVSAVESMQRSQDLAQSSVDDANNATTALEEIWHVDSTDLRYGVTNLKMRLPSKEP